MVWLALVLAFATQPLDEAIALRDAFDHDGAIAVLTRALDDTALSDEDRASYEWHLGVLLAESRRRDEALEHFAAAAALAPPSSLRIVVSPVIAADIEAAEAAARHMREQEAEADTGDERVARPPPDPNGDARPTPDESPLTDPGGEPPANATDLDETPPEPIGDGVSARDGDDVNTREGAATGLAAVVTAGVGATIVAGGVGLWGAGLGIHFSAPADEPQPEVAARNEMSAPLQIAGQVAVAAGLVVVGAGALLFVLVE